jgi:hypothetical protein
MKNFCSLDFIYEMQLFLCLLQRKTMAFGIMHYKGNKLLLTCR